MDERVRRTVETYESNADAYAEMHDDRAVVADMVSTFLDAVEDGAEAPAAGGADTGLRPRVLDVGPGPGWESAAFADHGFDAVAVDLTMAFLEQTRDREGDVDVVNGDMRSLPFAGDRFDGLWACASLLHVPRGDVPGTLEEFERVLAPGGATVVSIQRERGSEDAEGEDEGPGPYDDDRRHFEQYEPGEIRAAFENAGFVDVDAAVGEDDTWVRVVAEVR